MTTRSKLASAGVAIMVLGAVIGWGASRMVGARSGATSDSTHVAQAATSTQTNPQENPTGDLSPRATYEPAEPARRRAPIVERRPVRRVATHFASVRGVASVSGVRLLAGMPISVSVFRALSSGTAEVGEPWTGSVTASVTRHGRVVIPAGSTVHGVVAVANPARHGERATLRLALRSVTIDGRSYAMRGSSREIVAGSPRARNVGAIAGGTAAGALLGRAVGGSGRSTLIGALLGGGAATAAVAASKGYQATVPAGRSMQFTLREPVTVRT